MQLKITYRNGHYHWSMYDGPDGIDHYEGVADSLGCVFEKITAQRVINAHYYTNDLELVS
jgi:hypothetical protein